MQYGIEKDTVYLEEERKVITGICFGPLYQAHHS